MSFKLDCIVGARPNFMKISPIIREARERSIKYRLIHTGQHYDHDMSDTFFSDLDIPVPDRNLGIGSGSHAKQTGEIMIRLEDEFVQDRPDMVIVVGDVNSTLAAALVASKLGIKIAHIEAGYRSFDRTMPEEINRVIVDHIADYLFAPTDDAVLNLKREGIDENKIFMVGNIMAETLLDNIETIQARMVFKEFGLDKKGYALATIHRPENVDDPVKLSEILRAFSETPIPVLIPLHPRTKERICEFKLGSHINGNIITTKPLSYLDMMSFLDNACVALTDSGGLQEEACMLGIPCVTIRNNTERIATIKIGANCLVPAIRGEILQAVTEAASTTTKAWVVLDGWDEKVSRRVLNVLEEVLLPSS